MRDIGLADILGRLHQHYRQANAVKFDRRLPSDYRIAFNRGLRRLTGRITYGERLIEISHYHYRHYGYDDAVRTLEHEMLHLYLHLSGRPSGHNRLFKELAHDLGIRVFHDNPYPKNREPRHRWLFQCPACGRMVFRKRLRTQLACGVCCRTLAGGAWETRFQLALVDKVRFG